ncbi:MAG: SDR family NAD(P)-dependent oxidoreductase [Faecousia sp.]
MSLKGKRIVVTGASKGLGLGVVRRLCAEGANILAHYNSGDISQACACAEEAGVEFAAFQADLSNIDEVLAMAERINAYEDVYGLVNNAGICLFEDFFAITKESYDKTFDINIKAVFFLTQKITEKMVERGIHGRVVNFSSITALSGSATQVHYGAAKGAVSSFTHMAAEALGPYGITVNAVMPGPTPTKHNSAYLALETTRQELCGRMPMRTYGEAKYIADAVAYFLGEDAAWTTGTTLPVDGGYLAK